MPQRETTPFYPRSPYAAAKLYAYWITVNYREAYGMHASNGILFNHEGPMRGETFVTRKITRAVAAIESRLAGQALSRQSRCQARLGPCARLCRGHVADPAAAKPDDYVLATGETHSVREFVELAFARTGHHIVWRGRGTMRLVSIRSPGKNWCASIRGYYRPTEVDELLGDPSKARAKLGWTHKTKFARTRRRDGRERFEDCYQEEGRKDRAAR